MAGPAGTGSGATLPTEPRPLPGDWAVGELAILAALAETFVRGDATRRAALAAEALDRGLAPEQVSQLRLVLRILQSRPASLFLGGRPVAFRDLSMPDRERLLLRWATSRLPLCRSAFQAYRKLLTFLAYVDPGDAVVNPRWAAIWYERAQGPLAASPTPIRTASLPPAGSDGSIALEADVVVVGSGAGGGVVAAQLARSGHSAVVLEAGSLVTEPEMPADELAAFDRLYLDHGMTATWDGGISILARATVGGGRTVNWATYLPLSPVVRREWTRDHGLDGFDGAELDEDLATLETELGFAAPPNVPPKDDAILRGAASLGLEAAPTRRDAVDCGDCGSCGFGCRQGAKRSGLRAHLAEAWECGARIVPTLPSSEYWCGMVEPWAWRLAWKRPPPPPLGPWLMAPLSARRQPGSSSMPVRSSSPPGPFVRPASCSGPDLTIQPSAGTCGCIQSRSWPAASPSRWTCGGARCRGRGPSPSLTGRVATGGAGSWSSRRPGILA